MIVAKFGFDTSQRSCQVRQAVDFASASAAKSSRLTRRHEVSRESFRPTYFLILFIVYRGTTRPDLLNKKG